jgi:uncharacterized protein YndB with AHSA1/START domain
MVSSTDRIEKEVFLRARQERVWRALSNPIEFGRWFGMALDGEFASGARLTGRITPTTVDPAIAQVQEKHAGMLVTLLVERVEPMRLLSYRWHPFAIDPNVDYSGEPTTLVTFTLEPRTDGTVLRVVESGFDAIPIERRAAAFEANDGGWAVQVQLIEKYLSQSQ